MLGDVNFEDWNDLIWVMPNSDVIVTSLALESS